MHKKYIYSLLILLFISDLRSQDTILNLNKIDSNEFVLDGIISKTEIEGAKILLRLRIVSCDLKSDIKSNINNE